MGGGVACIDVAVVSTMQLPPRQKILFLERETKPQQNPDEGIARFSSAQDGSVARPWRDDRDPPRPLLPPALRLPLARARALKADGGGKVRHAIICGSRRRFVPPERWMSGLSRTPGKRV